MNRRAFLRNTLAVAAAQAIPRPTSSIPADWVRFPVKTWPVPYRPVMVRHYALSIGLSAEAFTWLTTSARPMATVEVQP